MEENKEMKELRNKIRKSMDILSEIIFTYMLFVLLEISVAFMMAKPKIFVPTFIISAIIVFVGRFRKKK